MSAGFFKSLFTVAEDSRRRREMEYLAKSVSIYDLERRQRELEKSRYVHTPFGL